MGVLTWDDIVVRLDALEAQNRSLLGQNRRLKRLAVAGLVIAGLVLCSGPGSTGQDGAPKGKKVIEADEFVVKDAAGKTRVALRAGELFLHNEDGDVRLALFSSKKGGSGLLMFTTNDHKQQLSILQTKEGFLSFGINDKNGKTRAMLATRPDGKPFFVLQDENQKSFFAQAQK